MDIVCNIRGVDTLNSKVAGIPCKYYVEYSSVREYAFTSNIIDVLQILAPEYGVRIFYKLNRGFAKGSRSVTVVIKLAPVNIVSARMSN